MNRVITMTTDFGVSDGYVAAMKGVILSINPEVSIVDISHDIEPQNIRQGAYVLVAVYNYFPPQTIHIAVVDPGVGSQRRAIVLIAPSALFVAPDNGIVSYIIDDFCRHHEVITIPEESTRRRLCPELRAVALTNKRYWRSDISPTFHGRDIFAPTAAHLSLRVNPLEMGEEVDSLTVFPLSRPVVIRNEITIGHVIHIDSFGNLITDVSQRDIPEGKILVTVAGRVIEGISSTYAEGGTLLATIGSSGRLEIAARNGNASRQLGLGVGDEIQLKPV